MRYQGTSGKQILSRVDACDGLLFTIKFRGLSGDMPGNFLNEIFY